MASGSERRVFEEFCHICFGFKDWWVRVGKRGRLEARRSVFFRMFLNLKTLIRDSLAFIFLCFASEGFRSDLVE